MAKSQPANSKRKKKRSGANEILFQYCLSLIQANPPSDPANRPQKSRKSSKTSKSSSSSTSAVDHNGMPPLRAALNPRNPGL